MPGEVEEKVLASRLRGLADRIAASPVQMEDAATCTEAADALERVRSQERQRVRRWAEEFEARMKGRMMQSQDAGEVVAISDIEWAMDELRDDVLAPDSNNREEAGR